MVATVHTDAATRAVYATDNSIYQVEPYGVVLPRSGAEVGALLAANHRAPHPRPVVARGAGTGTNGQSLTDGLVVDLKRHLNQILVVDPETRAVQVEPGVVAGRLNAEVAAHGLFWAPHASTLNRATVGGMIATDAAGKGSLVHGRTHRHVLALDVVLDDGTPWRAEPIPVAEAERLAAGHGRIARLWRDLLALPLAEGDHHHLPELARGFSGYGIDRFRRAGLVDPVALLCGSEGTLAVTTSATLRLTPKPAATVLLVASYASFADALDDAVELAVTKPTAIESFDETTLVQGRRSPAWPALGEVVGAHAGSVLLLEYSSEEGEDEAPNLAPVVDTLRRTGRALGSRAITDPAAQAAAWKVRADAVGLLAKMEVHLPAGPTGSERLARPTAFVEDCAVPVREMPAFIAGFRAILDQAGLAYGMFGHADVGCVHVRPALDLTDPAHEALVGTVTDQVVDLVAEHGGILWGEHGRGLRGDSAERFLSPDTLTVMRRVKSAFDPDDRLNPGKLYRPAGSPTPLVGVDAAPLRGQRDRQVPVEVRRSFGDAFACNGNGLCHHFDRAEVMCPSYKVTGDPALSPNGRADLIRAWLARASDQSAGAGPAGPAGFTDPAGPVGATGPEFDPDLVEAPGADRPLDEALAANLHQCLSCSACAGHCPVEVDIPELKSRFLDHYYRQRRRPLRHRLIGRFEEMAARGARLPRAFNRLGLPVAGLALGLADLPVPGPRPEGPPAPFLDRWGARAAPDLVVLSEVFTSVLEPATLTRAVEVLRSLDYSVALVPLIRSGKFDHVKGNRAAFARAARAQADLVRSVVEVGARPVVLESAVALLHRREYPTIDEEFPVGQALSLIEVIAERIDQLPTSPEPREVTLLGHCTERALAPDWLNGWIRALEAAGHTVTTPEVGCCGMAGIFGHERANRAMSKQLYQLSWADQVEGAPADTVVAATGYSCRSQVKRLAPTPAVHPVHLL